MFKKEGSFKPSKKGQDTPLKKSDRRKLRDAFLSILNSPNTDLITEELKQQIDFIFLDSKSDVSIRKIKQKDSKSNAGSTQIYTRSPVTQLAQDSSGSIFWPYTKYNQVLLMEINKMMVPSLALLSILPAEIIQNIIPTVVVPSIVSKYLCRGADLMRSGMLSIPKSHGGWVAVQAHGNIQPFAIGFVTNGTEESTIGADQKGVGVQIISCYGDEIYQCQMDPTAKPLKDGYRSELGGGIYDDGNYGNVGFLEGKRVYGLVNSQDEDEAQEDDETEEVNETNEEVDVDKVEIVEEADNEENFEEETEDDKEDPELTLLTAFFDASVRISKSQLPMPTSTFYSQHILPARKEGSFIDLKATKYKKIGTFLSEQASKGIITLGEKNGDKFAIIKSIDRSHPELKDARKRKKKEGSADDGDKKKLALANLYILPHNIVQLLHLNEDDVKATNAKSEDRKGTGFLTAPECRDILNKYLQENNLIDEFDPENCTLDGPLCDALFRKTKKELQNSTLGKNTYEESVSRKELNTKWLEKMDKGYAIVALPGSIIMSMKRGVPPKVSFVVEARQNRRKFVTRVRGLEEYGINPVDFANDVSKRFACSATIDDEAIGKEKLKKNCVECIFQGHLVEELQALLLGNEKCSHGGTKNSDYALPKGVFDVDLRKGVPKKKR